VSHSYVLEIPGREEEEEKGNRRTKEILPVHEPLHLVGLGFDDGGGEYQKTVSV